MKNAAIVAIIAFSLTTGRFAKYFRDTNSAAANKRGVAAFKKKNYDAAEKAFRQQDAIRPSPASAFDAGTAASAAKRHDAAVRDLTRAAADPAFKADALFNRGNDRLAANAYDPAIQDYTDLLKLRPSDRDGKRNLEIALKKKDQQQKQQQQGGGGGQKPQPQPKGQQQPQPQTGGQKNSTGSPDVDALLRSVQQQEREELSRMRQSKGEPRKIGW